MRAEAGIPGRGRTRCQTLSTPFTVCVLPVPGGPWIMTNGTGGMPSGAADPRCAAANCNSKGEGDVASCLSYHLQNAAAPRS